MIDIRNIIIDNLKKEIIGPNPNPVYCDPETGEERLLRFVHGSPKLKYGAGILYPRSIINLGIMNTNEDESNPEDVSDDFTNRPDIDRFEVNNLDEDETEEEAIALANQFSPSAMGFTIRINNKECKSNFKIQICSAKYEKGKNTIPVKQIDQETNTIINKFSSHGQLYESDFWTRIPYIIPSFEINCLDLIHNKNGIIYEKIFHDALKFQIYKRSSEIDNNENFTTLTFVIINNIDDPNENINSLLFQCSLSISTQNENLFVPYNEKKSFNDTDEEQELNLLYKDKRIFAIGHGCSVEWVNTISNNDESVTGINSSIIPIYDMPQIAPTSHVELSMFEFSDLGDWSKALISLNNLHHEYSLWIISLNTYIDNPNYSRYVNAIKNCIVNCNNVLKRIDKGIKLLSTNDVDSNVVKCFRWMNRAMLWQQQRSKAHLNSWTSINYNNQQIYKLTEDKKFETLDIYSSNGNGRWRPFQLAFILMNIESIIEEESKEREIVDLIWFPTGGGKTEAYLGLSAFTIFSRRIKGVTNDWDWDLFGGTCIIMRYTLRLLTTQQYERAASLICACELIRIENVDFLGDDVIDIGLWVGGDTTPNDNEKAQIQYKQLTKVRSSQTYNFVVLKCPCCGAAIGKVSNGILKGIKIESGHEGKVYFQCENHNCEFSNKRLPLKVVDDYIYESPPTLLLATVDKFAMIPWKANSGKLFGFRFNDNSSCNYRIKPPELIIQDELHLINGPLGTMVGLYETMVQTLCNDYYSTYPPFINDSGKFKSPKIVASSATISRAYEQVKSIYGIEDRGQLNIFPPQGVKFGDTWFSEEKPLYDQDVAINFPSRRYAGIMASSFPSAQTAIVRAYASVLQTIAENKQISNIDYYWTIVGYFNSIRELGGARSLLSGDIVERLGQLQNMNLVEKGSRRYLNRIKELTSQITSSDIPKNLKDIEKSFTLENNHAIDVCLATNMLATGVDIGRLGLMFIHGQPKTSAEYIQASSRVGRNVPKGPGLIITLYSPSKPRDKSQYEQFQGYHSRIYANVEPSSVTPFSINAREKALHAVFIGILRHFSSDSLRFNPIINDCDSFNKISSIITEIILKRVSIVDTKELLNVSSNLDLLLKLIERGFRTYGDAYNSAAKNNQTPLMYSNSSEVPDHILLNKLSLSTPTSMRGVDTESHLNIIP